MRPFDVLISYMRYEDRKQRYLITNVYPGDKTDAVLHLNTSMEQKHNITKVRYKNSD